jgi:DNA-binding transcriptional ArsR family regulator
MSPNTHKPNAPSLPAVRVGKRAASRFAALGDPTRLSLLAKLSRKQRQSISQLAQGSRLTRQAITKHLRVLERARIVRCAPAGRRRLYSLDPTPVHELREYLDHISAQWDDSLARLKTFVESDRSR